MRHNGVTILADHQGAACRQLAGAVEHRFDGIAVKASDEGAVTLDEGLAHFDCTIYREVEAGDHIIVLLELHAVDHAEAGVDHSETRADHPEVGSPLIFHRSGFGRLARAV